MQLRRWRRTADGVIFSAVVFLVLTIAAMLAFPGGTRFALEARHYRFFENHFSDLGGLGTTTGRRNDLSRHLFIVALTSVGVSLALFGPASRIWAPRGRLKLSGALASVCATLSGVGFIAVAFTPWNRDFQAHDDYSRAAFGLLAAFIVVLTTMQVRGRAPRQWIGANMISLLGLAAYALVQVEGPGAFTRHGAHVQVTVQKIIVYGSILNLGLQAWAVRARATHR